MSSTKILITVKIVFNTKLINQLRDYCQISATELLGGQGSNKALYFAEEGLSELLMSWHRKNLKDGFKEANFNDNYYFISCKNFVRNAIIKENRNKRSILKDYDNISLDHTMESGLEIELEDNTKKELEQIMLSDKIMQKQLEFVVNTLENCEWITPFDLNVFHHVHVEGRTLKSFAMMNKKHLSEVSRSNVKVKNVIQYLWEESE